MKRFFCWLLGVVTTLTLLLFSSCTKHSTSPDENQIPTVEKGLYSVKNVENEINAIGGEIEVSFLAMGNWEVISDSAWCNISLSEGEAGDALIILDVAPNAEDAKPRTATISISIEGYQSNIELCKVTQKAGVVDTVTEGRDVNRWMSSYMTTSYLWNGEFNKVKEYINYWKEPDAWLKSALEQMEGIDEDGSYYANGERYYYSTLGIYQYQSQMGPASRAGAPLNGYGISMLYPVEATSNSFYLLIAAVTPGSPADFAGLKRGMYITSYNNSIIAGNVLDQAYYTLMGTYPSTDLLMLELSEYQNGKLTELDPVRLSPSTYSANPITYKGIFQSPDKKHTIGYLVYSEFNMGADDDLINTFKQFKSYNVTDLILDLRYNVGGDVYSSAVMASAILGSSYEGKTYCQMKFNEYRTANGEQEFFYIGKDPSMVEYPKIKEAMDTALNLKRVYIICTGFTASASELVINGLRGLDVEVILVGQKTEGKNVGMEVITSNSDKFSDYDFGDYVYEFAPITFYNVNAKGFNDFHAGFTTDYEYVETNDILCDWDQQKDACVDVAMYHIFEDKWPANPTQSVSRSKSLRVVDNPNLRPEGRGSLLYPNSIVKTIQNK